MQFYRRVLCCWRWLMFAFAAFTICSQFDHANFRRLKFINISPCKKWEFWFVCVRKWTQRCPSRYASVHVDVHLIPALNECSRQKQWAMAKIKPDARLWLQVRWRLTMVWCLISLSGMCVVGARAPSAPMSTHFLLYRRTQRKRQHNSKCFQLNFTKQLLLDTALWTVVVVIVIIVAEKCAPIEILHVLFFITLLCFITFYW